MAREIERAIDDYLIRHPGMTRDQVRTALWLVTLGFEGEGEPSDDDDLPDEAGITEAASEKS